MILASIKLEAKNRIPIPSTAEVGNRKAGGSRVTRTRPAVTLPSGTSQLVTAVPPQAIPWLEYDEDDPHRLANVLITSYRTYAGLTLRTWQHDCYRYSSGCYVKLSDPAFDKLILDGIEREFQQRFAEKKRHRDANPSKSNGDGEVKKAKTTPSIRTSVADHLAAATLVDGELLPCWADPDPADPPAGGLMVFANGIVDVAAIAAGHESARLSHTPRLFALHKVGYNYDPNAPRPERWHRFLDSVWPTDQEAIDTLQEWFGYCLTADLSQDKILLMVGQSGGGKGVINRTLTKVVGDDAVCGPSMNTLAGDFGLQSLLGKSVAIIGDARQSDPRRATTVVGHLLSISGRDALDVDRKNKPLITVHLPTRIVVTSNEVPRLSDSSGALVGRYLPLHFKEKFRDTDRDDKSLEPTLATELPGILLWAIEGLRRRLSRPNGRFVIPASGLETLSHARRTGSPVQAWADDCCELCEVAVTPTAGLHDSFTRWCKEQGRNHIDDRSQFAQALTTAFPHLTACRPGGRGQQVPSYRGIRVLREIELPDTIPD